MRFFRVCLVIAALTVALMRPNAASKNLIISSPDDFNYLAHATSIVFGRFPDYGAEFSYYAPFNHAIGAPILASPFVFLFSLIDRWYDDPIVIQRTDEALKTSWTAFGYAIATQFYFLIGLLLCYLLCRDRLRFRRPAVTATLAVLGTGITHFVVQRPVSAHVCEFMLVAAMVYLMCAALEGVPWTASPEIFWGLSTCLATGLFLVRYNDIALALALGVSLLFAHRKKHAWTREGFAWAVGGMVLIIALEAFFIYRLSFKGTNLSVPNTDPGWRTRLWNSWVVSHRFFVLHPPRFYLERLWHVFFGKDWGLAVSAPLMLAGLIGLRYVNPMLRLHLLPAVAALSVNLFMIINWGTNGSFYGYRYLVFAALPLSIPGLGAWWDRGPGPDRRRNALLTLMAVVSLGLVLAFRTAPRFNMFRGETKWNTGSVNNEYAANVLGEMILHPVRYLDTVSRSALRPLASGRVAPRVMARYALMAAVPVLFGLVWLGWERRRRVATAVRAATAPFSE
jgi:hypothetical protein